MTLVWELGVLGCSSILIKLEKSFLSPSEPHFPLMCKGVLSPYKELKPGLKKILYTHDHLHCKEINPEYSLEGLTLKLNHQCFGHLMRRVNSLENTLMQGKIEGKRRRGQQRMRWLDGFTDSMNTNPWASSGRH